MKLSPARLLALVALIAGLLAGSLGVANAQQPTPAQCEANASPAEGCAYAVPRLMTLTDTRGRSVLVYCERDMAITTVVIRDGEWQAANGVPEGTACSASEFDARKVTNVSPDDGWTVIDAKKGFGAYACTNSGTAYAFVEKDGLRSYKENGPCYSGIMPG